MEPTSEPHQIDYGVAVMTGLALFLFVIALFIIVSVDGWFYYWTTP